MLLDAPPPFVLYCFAKKKKKNKKNAFFQRS
jgi:hypothetical protein